MNNPVNQEVRLLIVEDDEEDFLITSDLLDSTEAYQFDIDWLDQPDSAYETLTSNTYDLCLMDYRLGIQSGVDIVSQAVSAGCTAPIIMLTGQDDSGIEIAAARAGAVDYLIKDGLTPELLLRAIRYALVRKEIQHEQEERRNAEAANRSKSEFLANLSHEIRTPLTAIVGFTDLLIRSQPTDPSDLQEKLQSIRRNSKHLLSLLNDTLDLSKIEAGALELELASVDLLEFVTEVMSINYIAAKEKGLALSVDSQGKVPKTIRSDETRLRQVVLNLMSNAIKFTEQGSVRLTVFTERLSNRDFLVFKVTDTGIGISADELQQIFSPYQQVGDQALGTGLGLTISRHLTEMMGGRLTVDSAPGQGSSFTCYVDPGPIRSEELVDLAQYDGDITLPRLQTVDQSGHLLVVDDVLDNRKLLDDLLTAAGFAVKTASDGTEALQLLDDDQIDNFDLVLLDLNMPVMDGYSTLREIQKRSPSIPIMAMTAGGLRGERDKCLEMGFTGYLSKPFKSDQLIQDIESQLRAAGSSETNGGTAQTDHGLILVIEDNEDANHALSELLQLSGRQVLSAGSGEEALQLVSQNQFENILCDIHLGDWNGIDLLKELAGSQTGASFYIISGAEEPVRELAGIQNYTFIEKPVSAEKLIELGLLD
ncbi:MAG: response regulator [Gammaproteobacteria bacterium]|jgi:signal transduction histidine kinase